MGKAVLMVMLPGQLPRVDKIVKQRKARKEAGATPADLKKAHDLARSKGQKAANEFLKGITKCRISRVRVLQELVEKGLQAVEQGEAG